MTYDIQFTNAANKQFKKLSKAVQRQIKPVIDTLANNPRPHGYIELHGKLKGLYRVRSGDYRIIYTVSDQTLLVLVLKIGDRSDIY